VVRTGPATEFRKGGRAAEASLPGSRGGHRLLAGCGSWPVAAAAARSGGHGAGGGSVDNPTGLAGLSGLLRGPRPPTGCSPANADGPRLPERPSRALAGGRHPCHSQPTACAHTRRASVPLRTPGGRGTSMAGGVCSGLGPRVRAWSVECGRLARAEPAFERRSSRHRFERAQASARHLQMLTRHGSRWGGRSRPGSPSAAASTSRAGRRSGVSC